MLCQRWPAQDSAEMIQDSPWQCTSSKSTFLLLIGSNDQTHLIGLDSLSDMNYHHCFEVLIVFFVFGYRLPSSTNTRSTTNSIVISSRRELQTLVPPTTFFQLQRLVGSSHVRDIQTYSNLGKDVAFAQKNSTSTHLAFEFQIRKAKPENYAAPSGRSIEYYIYIMVWRDMFCIFAD